MFAISAPASDRNLLTLEELRAALDLDGTESDAKLLSIGLEISDAIANACRVPVDGVIPATLRRETIIDTMRLCRDQEQLIMTRRFVDTISNITVNGIALDPAEFEVDKAAGLARRLSSSGYYACWPSGIIVMTYTAGFETVPSALKDAAKLELVARWSLSDRDPAIKRDRTQGLGETEYFPSSSEETDSPLISPDARAKISSYSYQPTV
ncbi:phage associated protein [Methylocystis sp. SC2]|uniref:phage associated protein n=1 Tax=Methylocystis sp. (strain SC2) TaxID=187303 RepID=UPI00027AF035|nr:phage associated protein [Methylocystis sp. SC2]CCJ07093.1 Phage associated protein [Methylocystis sp. SC2]